MAAAPATGIASPTGMQPDEHAVQIVTISDDGTSFALQDDALSGILHKVPPTMKVAVLSVVGSFRTGKSFLLNFFLRYLRAYDEGEDGKKEPMCRGPRVDRGASEWIQAAESLHGSANRPASAAGDDEAAAADQLRSFAYRHGAERMTTGIWMWSRPFYVTPAGRAGERIAVLVVDTQGMFDRKTGVKLTSAIFGLSTLLSSHQVVNLTKTVGEDDLQSLALFSEYGRTAEAAEERAEAAAAASSASSRAGTEARPPFQSVTLLVRDCDALEIDVEDFDAAAVSAENEAEIARIMEEASTEDIGNTRAAIEACFESVSTFRLVHPGKAVTSSKFAGEVTDVDADFLCLVEHFVDETVRRRLRPKAVRHVSVTAMETLRFMRVYARLFKDATTFPEPQSILDATADANNRNAVTCAFGRFDEELDAVMSASPSNAVPAEELERTYEAAREGALGVFNSRATFGPDHLIRGARAALCKRIDSRWDTLKQLNAARDPFRFLTLIAIPALAMVVAYVFAFATDTVCTPWLSLCGSLGSFLRFVASILFLGLVAFFFARGSNAVKHMTRVVELLTAAAGASAGGAAVARSPSAALDAAGEAEGFDLPGSPPGVNLRRRRRTD